MTKARDIASAAPAPSTVSATELGYLDGVTSAIQTQVDAKTAKSTLTTTGDIYYASSANTPARLGIGSTGNVLTVAGGVPTWAAPGGFVSGGNRVATNESTTSNTYTDLATVQSVTITTGTKAVVWGSFGTSSTSTGSVNGIAIQVSGSTSIGASITYGVDTFPLTANTTYYFGFGFYFNSLTAGSNTFTLKFIRNNATGNFFNRHLIVADMGS
jgi:hypothetical protein